MQSSVFLAIFPHTVYKYFFHLVEWSMLMSYHPMKKWMKYLTLHISHWWICHHLDFYLKVIVDFLSRCLHKKGSSFNFVINSVYLDSRFTTGMYILPIRNCKILVFTISVIFGVLGKLIVLANITVLGRWAIASKDHLRLMCINMVYRR